MALDQVKKRYERYAPAANDFYRDHYHHVLMGLMVFLVLTMIAIGVLLYQILHRPLPAFDAVQPDKKQLTLVPYTEPNLLPATLLRWSSKAATLAYTFDFVRYEEQLAAARPYFTEAGWVDFQGAVNRLVTNVVERQLFVYGVVAGVPVISNQGELPGRGEAWRVQIPFLVTFRSANRPTKAKYFVSLTLIRVPTRINPQGVGIDQFVMTPRS